MQIIKFEDLNLDDKHKVRDVYTHIDKLQKFANKLNPEIMEVLFEEKIASHLWSIFMDCDRDFITFLNLLSTNNKSIIITNLFGNYEFAKTYGFNL
jgi:hypothetical protein